jgi:hypothetical protein
MGPPELGLVLLQRLPPRELPLTCVWIDISWRGRGIIWGQCNIHHGRNHCWKGHRCIAAPARSGSNRFIDFHLYRIHRDANAMHQQSAYFQHFFIVGQSRLDV